MTLSPRQVQKGIRRSILASTLGTVWSNTAGGMPFTMLLEALGSSGRLMGFANSIRQFMLLVQVPWEAGIVERPEDYEWCS